MATKIEGTVAMIGEAGRLITDIAVASVEEVPNGDSTSVVFGGHETVGLYPPDHGQPDATMVASKGESGFVEIEIVGVSLADMLGIKTGEKVIVSW